MIAAAAHRAAVGVNVSAAVGLNAVIYRVDGCQSHKIDLLDHLCRVVFVAVLAGLSAVQSANRGEVGQAQPFDATPADRRLTVVRRDDAGIFAAPDRDEPTLRAGQPARQDDVADYVAIGEGVGVARLECRQCVG